jgi:hypothetical protein
MGDQVEVSQAGVNEARMKREGILCIYSKRFWAVPTVRGITPTGLYINNKTLSLNKRHFITHHQRLCDRKPTCSPCPTSTHHSDHTSLLSIDPGNNLASAATHHHPYTLAYIQARS